MFYSDGEDFSSLLTLQPEPLEGTQSTRRPQEGGAGCLGEGRKGPQLRGQGTRVIGTPNPAGFCGGLLSLYARAN